MGQRAGARVHPAPGTPAALLTITDTQPHDPTRHARHLGAPVAGPTPVGRIGQTADYPLNDHQRLPTPRDATTRPP